MSPKAILVVGASRGIGLELVRQLAQDPFTTVYAAMRKTPSNSTLYSAEAAASHPNIHIIQLEQNSTESVASAVPLIPELDTVILNAAIGEDDHLLTLPPERLVEYLTTNVVGPHRVVQAFLPALRARTTRKIVYISSSAGSLSGQVNKKWGLQGPYAITKAAGNMAVVQWHNELSAEGFTVVAVHPGWVDTDMGRLGGDGGMPVEKSAEALVELERKIDVEDGAKFLNYDGSVIPY